MQRILGRKHLLQMRQQTEAGHKLSESAKDAVMGVLTNFYDATVQEALRLMCDVPKDPGLVPILRSEAVQKAINAFDDDDIPILYRLALAKHSADSVVR